MNLDQSRMRDHLISCIETSCIPNTPQMKTVLRSSKIELMCECRQSLLNNICYGSTIQCSKCSKCFLKKCMNVKSRQPYECPVYKI